MTSTEIGSRSRKARLAVGLTQASAATQIGVSRPTLIAIEKGTRQVKPGELDSLAASYSTSVNRIMAEDAVHVDLQARFRKLGGGREAAHRAVALLNKLASASLELERLVGIRSVPMMLPEQPIWGSSIGRQAAAAALAVRQFAAIGLTPVRDIVSLLEFELGFRMFARKLPSAISGVFGYDPAVGACILLNANHHPERQAMTAAHELGHFVSNRSFGDIVSTDWHDSTVEERFANEFSYEFLMPTATVLRRLHEVVETCRKFSARHLVLTARTFYVSAEAMCRRLERLQLLPSGTYESLVERGFSARSVPFDRPSAAIESGVPPLGSRLSRLVAAALDRGLLSEGQVARMLDLDRVEVREIVDSALGPGGDEIEINLS